MRTDPSDYSNSQTGIKEDSKELQLVDFLQLNPDTTQIGTDHASRTRESIPPTFNAVNLQSNLKSILAFENIRKNTPDSNAKSY